MTYEQAYYHKLMLEIGLTDEFDAALDDMLEQEDPLSDLALALSTCGGRISGQIHILNEYILGAAPEQIDSQAVFSMVADRFRTIYENDPGLLEQITKWMYSAAWSSGWWTDDPWNTMYLMNDYLNDVSEGLVTEEQFMKCFRLLIYEKAGSSPLSERFSGKKPRTLIAKLKQLFTQ